MIRELPALSVGDFGIPRLFTQLHNSFLQPVLQKCRVLLCISFLDSNNCFCITLNSYIHINIKHFLLVSVNPGYRFLIHF